MTTYINTHKLKDPIGFLHKLYANGKLRMDRRADGRFLPCMIDCRMCAVGDICHSEVGTIPHFDKETFNLFFELYPEAKVVL